MRCHWGWLLALAASSAALGQSPLDVFSPINPNVRQEVMSCNLWRRSKR
jgi:hypothetical protein